MDVAHLLQANFISWTGQILLMIKSENYGGNSCEEMMMGMMISLMMMLTTLKMPLEYWGVVGSACPC